MSSTPSPRAYGDNRSFRKIDIFVNGRYYASTTWSKTCKEARAKVLATDAHYFNTIDKVTARFSKSY